MLAANPFSIARWKKSQSGLVELASPRKVFSRVQISLLYIYICYYCYNFIPYSSSKQIAIKYVICFGHYLLGFFF